MAMRTRALSPLMLRAERPSRALGVAAVVGGVAAATGVIYPLKHVAPVLSLGVVYLVAVVTVSVLWGLAFGVATAVLSAGAFSFFHLPPVGRFELADSRNWIGLSAFVAVAIAMGLVAELARSRAREIDERRREADLSSELAQLLLGASSLEEALPRASLMLAAAIEAPGAEIRLGEQEGGRAGTISLPLAAEERAIGTLRLPETLSGAVVVRLRERIVPPLVSILAAALHREALQAELVETAALRRSDEMKTAVLRSVSHDLRTPVTAILGAAETLDPDAPRSENVTEVKGVVLDAATRLWLLIEKLLDLSLLQAGGIEPRIAWFSIEDVLHEAVEQTRAPSDLFTLSIDRDLPSLEGDAAQLERAFVNVLENAARYSGEKPVSVRARVVGDRLRVRIVDQGPGIHLGEQEKVFLPFYRGSDAPRGHHGSGLGLAIARGFLEVNGGRIAIESQPGQGTSFVIEFPLLAVGEPQPVPVRRR